MGVALLCVSKLCNQEYLLQKKRSIHHYWILAFGASKKIYQKNYVDEVR